ncbi:RagB/SusD family nutrient uptake outer membrane protein [Pedobacter sp. SL55]|uniref:RagB/SusD family nutrient uptake outer membrane protein n=1 Tax=Pedobacter sp. SL55 TaxID=2995161 RepID=UPI00226EF53D|nr:RagB/SusD family nutrient uptake outer membrane protein [Pedobacter sp. SL55]WAC39449.1 RagB/SusD family nutrient uptake outer membrane protein [Pedobacter sp. SL55]
MNKKFIYIALSILSVAFMSSCRKDLLNQNATVSPNSNTFWLTEADAVTGLMGNYNEFRPCFDRDYHFDGHGDFLKMYNTGAAPISMTVNSPSAYGNGAATLYRELYGSINTSNYVIENIRAKLLPNAVTTASRQNLEAIIGEARLLRGIAYFRLISLWGDVPYIYKIVNAPIEVDTISRSSITKVKDSIYADFTYAAEKLPNRAAAIGRAAKPAALAFRGKLQLFWGSWKKHGWPELEGFQQSAAEARTAFEGAAADFNRVITEFGLNLFRGGAPGEWGEMGKADVLPNYYYMFIPSTGNPNADGEMLMVLTHGGNATGQSEEYMRVWTGVSVGLSQNQAIPRWELADRYQSTITGDFLPKMTQLNPSTNPAARTTPNSSVNPDSYKDRDYRMKATLLWDNEKIMGIGTTETTGFVAFRYKTWSGNITIDGVTYPAFNDNTTNLSGLQSRKFVRNYGGQNRSSGDYNWPLMRLADVFLMYAEATNEVNGPQPAAIALVNRVRARGKLPALAASKTANATAFFDAIEQERIVELFGEGQRAFDLRRWRKLETVFGAPYGAGKWFQDSWGNNWERFFFNADELVYQRCYIYQIPEAERVRNSNLTQNKPWR